MIGNLPLSDAVRLGSLLTPIPLARDTRHCAIGMALTANNILPRGTVEDHASVEKLYRWLSAHFICPWCGEAMTSTRILYHPFDRHVMSGQITIDKFCDWLATVQPSQLAKCESGSETGAACAA